MTHSPAALAVCTVTLIVGLAVPSSAATIYVRAGESLQSAMNAAQPGDVILLQAGATFIGNFTMPLKSGAAYITIRTSTDDALLPAAGVRITPAQAPLLARIQSPNAAPAMRTVAGSHHWRLQLLEFGPNLNGFGDIVQIGDGSGAQFLVSQAPSDIELDRVYIHGDPTVGQKRGVALNARSVTIWNCYIADIKSVGQDSQAIAGWNGPGPYTIENNYLEAAGENVLFGGADPAIPYLVPEDVVFRRNHVAKPLAWRGQPWQIKNLFELKNARRVLVEYNIFENNWAAAQPGYAILFTPRNQDGGCPWCAVTEVTFQYNVVRNTGGVFNLTGYDDLHPSGQTRAVTIRHNLFYGIGSAWGSGWFVLIGHEPRDVSIDHNTIDHDGTAVVYAYGGTAASPERILGFAFTNNAARHNAYGINGANASSGNLTIAMYFPDGVIRGNWLPGGNSSRYPAGNLFGGAYDSGFVSVASGDYRVSSGSPLIAAATDGSNIGADMPTLLASVAGVVEGVSPAAAPVQVPAPLPPVVPAPPAPPAPAPPTCTTTLPAPGWVCVDGGWVPPNHPLALSAGAATSPASASSGGGSAQSGSTSAPVFVPSTCSTVRPASTWVCVNGGWLPPGHPLALGAGTSNSGGGAAGGAVVSAPSNPPPVSGSTACTTPRPGADWVCVNGGWVPPNHPLAGGGEL